MSLLGFEQLFARADREQPGVPIAVAGGEDPTVLEALRATLDRGWVQPILCGPEAQIRAVSESIGVSLEGFELVEAEQSAVAAVQQIREGRAKLLMKGQIATPELMKAVLSGSTGLRSGKTICQVVLMEIPRDDRRFLMADTGITIEPTLEQSAQIVEAVTDIGRELGADPMRIAVMAATEKVTDAMPETHLANRLGEHLGQQSPALIEGPLSFDLAYSSAAGRKKRLDGQAVGAADAMVFPNLLSANLTVKAMMYSAECRFGGVLAGTTNPVVFMSRADDVPTRIRSLAFALARLR
jgi:phosphotransacetylase